MKASKVIQSLAASALSVAGILATSNSVAASPVAIDFSSGGLDPNDPAALQYRAYLEDGMSVKGSKSQSWGQPGLTSGQFHWKNGSGSYNRITVTELGGDGVFDVDSLDIIADPLGLLFSGQKTDLSWVSLSVPLNAAMPGSPYHVNLNFDGLIEFRMQTLSRSEATKYWISSIDNMVVDRLERPIKSEAVPDAGASASLLGLGLLGLGAMKLRARR